MTVAQACVQLLEIVENKRKDGTSEIGEWRPAPISCKCMQGTFIIQDLHTCILEGLTETLDQK